MMKNFLAYLTAAAILCVPSAAAVAMCHEIPPPPPPVVQAPPPTVVMEEQSEAELEIFPDYGPRGRGYATPLHFLEAVLSLDAFTGAPHDDGWGD